MRAVRCPPLPFTLPYPSDPRPRTQLVLKTVAGEGQTDAELGGTIHDFLCQVDPTTGYEEDNRICRKPVVPAGSERHPVLRGWAHAREVGP